MTRAQYQSAPGRPVPAVRGPGGHHHDGDLPRRSAALGADGGGEATDAGFNPTRLQEIGPHYVKTRKIWADALEAHREEAIAIQGQTVYDCHDKYLNGCQRYFREGNISVHQFTLQK